MRAKAIIDTGAQGTVGNLALREALMRQPPRNAAHQDIIGVTLDVQTGDDIALPDIDFGHLTVQGVHVVFGDMYLFQHWKMTDEPTLTLGMDLLGSFDILIIDYNRHELQIRPREAPGPHLLAAHPPPRPLRTSRGCAARAAGSAAARSTGAARAAARRRCRSPSAVPAARAARRRAPWPPPDPPAAARGSAR